MTAAVGSLCSGYGGLDLAVCAHYGAEVAWHSEVDPDACAVLDARWPDVPNLGDLTIVDWAAVPQVDVLTAGYPCQPWSEAGRRKGENDVRHIWPWIAQAIGVLRPRVVVLENVRGHTSLGGAAVIGDLACMGYVGRWGVVPASATGAPHRRYRLFIVAHAERTAGREPERHCMAAAVIRAAESGERHSPTVAHADGQGRQGWAGPADGAHGRTGPVAGGNIDWAEYAGAIERWERILGRPAPTDVLVGRQLNAKLSEWMMGLDDGWVTDVLPNRKALKVLGNGVVPQQAALALRLLDTGVFL